MDFLVEIDLVSISIHIMAAVAVILVGRFLAHITRKLLLKSLQKTDLTESLNLLITTLTYYSIIFLSLLVALAVLGVPASALVGATTVIIVVLAITLQTSLGDLAATIVFMLFKPFVVGDLIETGGVLGIVQEIEMFSSIIVTPDHITHVLPNSKIQAAGLANYSKIGSIRVDMTFGISYDSDVDQAKQIIEEILSDDDRVLKEPAPQVFLQKLADSSIDIAVWPFVMLEDFLSFQAEIVEFVKKSFDEAGILIPYPQRDIHLVNEN